MPDVRLLLTNDFFGAFAPSLTSWGTLPGARALIRLVDRLREDAATSAWIDAGDFSGGGPLSPHTDGAASWAAAATLGIDAAVPGNHEFDFGDMAMAEHAGRLPFPLVAADLADAPAWTGPAVRDEVADHVVIASPGGRSVAVVGLCLPERRGLFVYDTPTDLRAAAERATAVVDGLRGIVDHVVVVVHEGVPVYPGIPLGGSRLTAVQGLDALVGFCAAMAGTGVDAVVGGHSLGRWVGDLGGVPFVQPWALGLEVGVIDIDDRGVTVGAHPVPASWAKPWTGVGADLLDALGQEIVGHLEDPLTTPSPDPATSLAQRTAEGVLAVSGADIALVSPIDLGCTQLALDGRLGHLPRGAVSQADVLRVLPWPGGERGDAVACAELGPSEVARLVEGFAAPGLAAGVARRHGSTGGAVALDAKHRAKAARLVGRDLSWTPTGRGQRDGLRAALAR